MPYSTYDLHGAGTLKIPPARLPLFFMALFPAAVILIVLLGISGLHIGFFPFIVILAACGYMAQKYICARSGLTITQQGISLSRFGKPTQGFDLAWSDIEGFALKRDGIPLKLWVQLKSDPKPQAQNVGNFNTDSLQPATDKITTLISRVASEHGGGYRIIPLLHLPARQLKETLEKRLQNFQAMENFR